MQKIELAANKGDLPLSGGGNQEGLSQTVEESQHLEIPSSTETGKTTTVSTPGNESGTSTTYDSIIHFLQSSYLRRNLNLFNRTSSVRQGRVEANESTDVEANRVHSDLLTTLVLLSLNLWSNLFGSRMQCLQANLDSWVLCDYWRRHECLSPC